MFTIAVLSMAISQLVQRRPVASRDNYSIKEGSNTWCLLETEVCLQLQF